MNPSDNPRDFLIMLQEAIGCARAQRPAPIDESILWALRTTSQEGIVLRMVCPHANNREVLQGWVRRISMLIVIAVIQAKLALKIEAPRKDGPIIYNSRGGRD